jgi:flavodoxin
MKSAIVYYSYTGNTKKVVLLLSEYLQERSEIVQVALKDRQEDGKFFSQAAKAFRHHRAEIEPVEYNLASYDLVCVGTPVWAFGPAPAVNTYLDACAGVAGKPVVLFTTFGSGVGNERCLQYMQANLARKEVKDFSRFSIQQGKVKDREFVLSEIKKIMRL